MQPQAKLEIFCGTGGVGKTTVAASRACFLAKSGKKVLLMTVDPSKRLKQVLNITENDSGVVNQCSISLAGDKISLSGLLLSPNKTFKRIFKERFNKESIDNKILNVLIRPYGGLNELLGLIELNYQLKQDYDVVILDTAPGSHFIDFLNSGENIKHFFNKNFMEVFGYLSQKSENLNIFKLVVKTGISKLLGYLEKVTGKEFVAEFTNAVATIYDLQNNFLDAAKLPEKLKSQNSTLWFLVTAASHSKHEEAKLLNNEMKAFSGKNCTFILNKTLSENLEAWSPCDQTLKSYKDISLRKELRYSQSAKVRFPEVFDNSTQKHLETLTLKWREYSV